jgi:hypothetical protein
MAHAAVLGVQKSLIQWSPDILLLRAESGNRVSRSMREGEILRVTAAKKN